MAHSLTTPETRKLEASLYCSEDVNDESEASMSDYSGKNVLASSYNMVQGMTNPKQNVFHASSAAIKHLSLPETMKVGAFLSSITGGEVKRSTRLQNKRIASKASLAFENSKAKLSSSITLKATGRSCKEEMIFKEPIDVVSFSSSKIPDKPPEASAAEALANLMTVPVFHGVETASRHAPVPLRVSSSEPENSSVECSSNSAGIRSEQGAAPSQGVDAIHYELKEPATNTKAVTASEGKNKRRRSTIVSSSSSPEGCSKKKPKAAVVRSTSNAGSIIRKLSESSESRAEDSQGSSSLAKVAMLKKSLPQSTRRSSTYLPCNAGKDRRWTTAEDNRLRRALVFDGVKDWKKICSEYFDDERTPDQCQKRWLNVLSMGLVKGKWSPDEDEAIINELLNGVTSWKQLAKKIPGRLSKQCRERWQNHLDPCLKNQSWTSEEDDILKEAQSHWGNRWKVIAMLYPGRSETSLKNRWNSARFKPYKKGEITTNYMKFNLPLEKRIQTDKQEAIFVSNARKTANEIEQKGIEVMMADGHSDDIELTDEAREALREAQSERLISIKTRKSPRQKKVRVVKNLEGVVRLTPAESLRDYHESKPNRQVSELVPPVSPKSAAGNRAKRKVKAQKKKKLPLKNESTNHPSPPPQPSAEVLEPNPMIYPGAPGTTTTTQTITTSSGQQQQIVIIQQACCACCCLHKQQHQTVQPPFILTSTVPGGANSLPQDSHVEANIDNATINNNSGISRASAVNQVMRTEGPSQNSNSNMDVLMKAIKMC